MIETTEFHLRAVLDDAKQLVAHSARQMPIDRYVAASLMQKAIRRGDAEWAIEGASTLLQIDSRYLWRRLIITLFEDVGLHDTRLAWRALASRQHCLKLRAATWPIVQLIVGEMTRAKKSQAGNHALQLAAAGAAKARSIDLLIDRPLSEATRWTLDESRSIPERVHAIWTISGLRIGGTSSPDAHPEGSNALGWAVFDRIVPDGEIRALARAGVQAGASMLAVSASLAAPASRTRINGQPSASDPMPPSSLIGEVPSWAIDMYTRAGKRALMRACTKCPTIRAVLRHHGVPPALSLRVLSSVHFEIESACLRDRIQRPEELALLDMVRSTAVSPWMHTATELSDALVNDWAIFQALRRRSYEDG